MGFDKIYYGSWSRASAADVAEVAEQDVVIGMRPSARRYPVKDVIELERYLVSQRQAPVRPPLKPPCFFTGVYASPVSDRVFGGRPVSDGHVMMEHLLNDSGH